MTCSCYIQKCLYLSIFKQVGGDTWNLLVPKVVPRIFAVVSWDYLIFLTYGFINQIAIRSLVYLPSEIYFSFFFTIYVPIYIRCVFTSIFYTTGTKIGLGVIFNSLNQQQ